MGVGPTWARGLIKATTTTIIIIKNEKVRVTLCENAAGALYIVNKMLVDGQRNVQR